MVVPAPEPQADKPHVTVGIPFHRGACAEHLRLAVDSILNQTHRPYRVHLIQDGPVSDDLTALVNDYVARGPHIEHLLIPDNSGLPNALNLTIQQTRSPYYARMDADDISRPDRLEVEARYLGEHPAVDIVGSWAIEFHDDPDEADTFYVAANVNIAEGQVTGLSAQELAEVYAPLGIDVFGSAAQSGARSEARSFSADLTWLFLLLALLCLLGENFVGYRISTQC